MAGSTDVDVSGEQLVYLYCVTAQPPKRDGAEDRPGGLYLVHEAGLYAVVCRVEADEFAPSNLRRNVEDLPWVAAQTMRHERIIEAVMQNACVIPFRFATLFHTNASLRLRLRTHAAEFQALLQQLEDKAEWGVKVYCDSEKLESTPADPGGAMSHLDEAICLASPGKAFLLQKKRKDLARAALAGRRDGYVERTIEQLGTIGFQSRLNKVPPQRTTEGRGTMILNAAFLVGNRDAPSFVAAANILNERWAEEGVLVECTGPWPPYNFCDLAKKVVNG